MRIVGILAICIFNSSCSTQSQHPAVGWSVYAPARGGADQDRSIRYIVSGAAGAIQEFTREAQANGWSVEDRASGTSGLVFVQFRAPFILGQSGSFIDRYLVESPRRLNIAGVVAPAEIAGPDGPAEKAARSRAALDRIADECQLPNGALRLIGNGELHFQPPPDATYESVNCALRKISEDSDLRIVPMGFVGNAAPLPSEEE